MHTAADGKRDTHITVDSTEHVVIATDKSLECSATQDQVKNVTKCLGIVFNFKTKVSQCNEQKSPGIACVGHARV